MTAIVAQAGPSGQGYWSHQRGKSVEGRGGQRYSDGVLRCHLITTTTPGAPGAIA
jgi:hypothetical protein